MGGARYGSPCLFHWECGQMVRVEQYFGKSLTVFGEADESTTRQMVNVMKSDRVAAASLMADNHLGYSIPIGGVVGYRDAVSPSGVGYDIACGNKAVRLADPPRFDLPRMMDRIYSTLSFGLGRRNQERVDHELFHDDPGWGVPVCRGLRDLAMAQLGTIGSGNHYVDLMLDEEDNLWVAVHFGSRGFGHKIATHFIRAGGGKDGMFVDPVVFDVSSDLGQQYLLAMNLAGRYAYAGRDWVCQKVAQLIGGRVEEEVHVHHNFAWMEEHDGERLYVVRKGATPISHDRLGYIGGSMGDNAVIVRAREGAQSSTSFRSGPHGAGRVMSRNEAAGKWTKGRRTGGKITRKMMLEWLRPMGVELRGAGADEAPHVYKRLGDVLRFHPDVEVVHTLRPIGVAMAGEDVQDPFKD
jgi:tRNA-splicing ligase RtcB (3'-phosphate/5'-hydroxy nucleic acid ligase)